MTHEVMQQALYALLEYRRYDTTDSTESMADAVIQALKEAIAQPVQPLREFKDNLTAEIARLTACLKAAYCQKIGTDTPHGLDSCDDYRDWVKAQSVRDSFVILGRLDSVIEVQMHDEPKETK